MQVHFKLNNKSKFLHMKYARKELVFLPLFYWYNISAIDNYHNVDNKAIDSSSWLGQALSTSFRFVSNKHKILDISMILGCHSTLLDISQVEFCKSKLMQVIYLLLKYFVNLNLSLSYHTT